MPAISGLYRRNPIHLCHAEVGVRMLDVACGRMALSPARLAAFAGGKFRPAAKYVKGTAKDVKFFGAGYCYIETVVPEVRVRVARILGPCCLVIDVLRMMRLVGAAEVRTYELVDVGGGSWHYEAISAELVPAWSLARDLLAVVTENHYARIGGRLSQGELRELISSQGVSRHELEMLLAGLPGTPSLVLADGPRVAFDQALGVPGLPGIPSLYHPRDPGVDCPLVEWLRVRGWKPPEAALGDLFLVGSSTFDQGSLCSGGRAKVKVWALIGDSVLRLVASVVTLSLREVPERCADRHRLAENAKLAVVSDRVGLTACLGDGVSASPKVKADALEALVGLVASYAGLEVANKVIVGEVYSQVSAGC